MNPDSTVTAPKLRTDLIISRQGTPEKLTVVLKDPVTGRFFRFREIEAYILQQLRGSGTSGQIRSDVEKQFGANLPQATFDQFLANLNRIGLLEQPSAPSPAHVPLRRRIRGDPLYLRINAFNPNRLLDRLVKRLRFLFTPSFVFASAAVIVTGASLTAANWSEIMADFPRLYSLQSLFLAYMTMLAVVTAHEFAHGLTCKHFGGKVSEMGFMLLYFQPAFYCNVSDAWLFPRKSSRLWVTFAGAYFEVFIWALATIVWRLTDPFTLVNYMSLVVMATSGIKTLFNLNPLIKLDGYYLLSDWLDIPNLRARSFAFLGQKFRWLLGGAPSQDASSTTREKLIYVSYGLLAWVYSFWLLSFVLLYFGGFLIGRYQGWGFVLLTALVIGMFRLPLKNALRDTAARFSLKATMSKWGKRLLKLGIVAAVVAGTFLVRMELRISTPFLVLPLHNADVRAEVEGIIQEVLADEGQSVRKGAPIVTLSERNVRAELRKTVAEIEERQARLKLLKAGTRPEEIDLAKTILAKAEERVFYATNILQMQITLFEEKLISKKEVEDAREVVAIRRKEIQEAQDKLNLLRAGSRYEEIEATEAEVSRLQAQHQHLDEKLHLLKVLSPIDGVVTTHKLKDKVGQAVKEGDLIAKVHAMTTVTVEMAVPEKEIADVRIGAAVMLKARAYPERRFQGKVTAIAPIATEPPDARTERTVRVTTQLDNADLLLKPEMTGHAKIYCGQRRLIGLITRRFVRFLKVEFWSWW